MEQARVVEMMPGCKIFLHPHREAGNIMFGCPPEIVKVCATRRQKVPSIIVLPEEFVCNYGVNQASVEFPLYDFVFVQGRWFQGEKLIIIGSAEQIVRINEIIRLTLLGFEREEMEKMEVRNDIIDFVLGCREKFALQKDGQLARVPDFVELIPFKDELVELDEIKGTIVKRIDHKNIFDVMLEDGDETIDINFREPQEPPFCKQAPGQSVPRPVFGVTSVGDCTSGFDSSGSTTGLLLWINGMAVGVDAPAWYEYYLELLGIGSSEIKAYIITHAHEDHWNIVNKIANGRPFYLITDRLGYETTCAKAATILNRPIEQIKDIIVWKEIVVNEPFHWYGAKFNFFYTAHPIPCLGFSVEMNGEKIIVSGDTAFGKQIKDFKNEPWAVNFCNTIKNLPFEDSTLTFMDLGNDNAIHPSQKEFDGISPKILKFMIPTHTSQLIPWLAKYMQLPHFGKTWEIIPQGKMHLDDMLRLLAAPLISGLSEMWRNTLLSQGKMCEYCAGQNIITQGQEGKKFYLIISGAVNVLAGDQKIAVLKTGDSFGETSLLTDEPCNATIQAISHLKLLEVNASLFQEFAKGTGLEKTMKKISKLRPFIVNVSVFAKLPPHVLDNIAAEITVLQINPGECIIKQGDVGNEFFAILDGKADIIVEQNGTSERIASISKNQIFGEMALVGNGYRNASVIAVSRMAVAMLTREKFEEFLENSPGFKIEISKMVESRQAAH